AAGMAGFIHHPLAIACSLFNPVDLVVVEGRVARHSTAPSEVADTSRAAHLSSRTTGEILVSAEVGKYFPTRQRWVLLKGSDGQALLDRETENIRLRDRDGNEEVIRAAAGDLGYRSIFEALAERKLPSGLL